MKPRAIHITEPKSGLSVTAPLLDNKAPANVEFLWQYLAEQRVVEGIHAMWTGPEISCPIPSDHLKDAAYAIALPPENATGNFTKVIQRVPVRIAIPKDALDSGKLRAGLSVVVAIDSRTGDASKMHLADAE